MKKKQLTKLLDELLSAKPRLVVVQDQMKAAGLKPATDLVACMETTLKAMKQLEIAGGKEVFRDR